MQSPVAALPSGKQLYDSLMGDIEPELVSSVIPALAARYAGETPDAHTSRMERYKRAFEEYDRRCAEYLRGLRSDVATFRKQSRKAVEGRQRSAEQAALQTLEDSIFSS